MSKIMKRIRFVPKGDICEIRIERNDVVMNTEVSSKKLKAFCEGSITEFMNIDARIKISKKANGILFESKTNQIYFGSKNLKALLSNASKELS